MSTAADRRNAAQNPPPAVTTLPPIWQGSTVEITRNAGQWAGLPLRVTRVNAKTYSLRSEDGRTLKAPHQIVGNSDKPFTDKALERTLDQAREEGPFILGSLVTVDTTNVRLSGWTYPADQRFVVLADRLDKVRIVKLGGEMNKYWNLPRGCLTRAAV